MTLFSNGQVPASQLITFASGTNNDGYWEHQLPPGTYAKHLALVKLGQERRGRTLQITPGWNAYRPIGPQKQAKARAIAAGRPQDAATVGESSHGGTFTSTITGNKPADVFAIDYGNWLSVWGSYGLFAAACREVGLIPGVFDWELWHVIDPTPYAAAPAALRVTSPIPVKQKEHDMLIIRTPQHGIYTAAPGSLVAHASTKVSSGLEYRGKAEVMDVNPDDLLDFIRDTSGCTADQIPAPGYMWSIAAQKIDGAVNTIAAAVGKVPSIDDIAQVWQDHENQRVAAAGS